MILSLAKKHQKKLIAPVIAGGIIYASDYYGVSIIASSFAPIASEVIVIGCLSWLGGRSVKAKEKEVNAADKRAKDNLEGELDYFTKLANQIPDTHSDAKQEASKHIADLVKKRMEHSRQTQNKLDQNRKNATDDYQKSKSDLAELESEMQNQIQQLSDVISK
ncbi:hypothetical protein BWZ29_20775 [Enterobacter cancerogenus]|jgi:hypothetical protein|uniref:hypothetical protein n=1 Tax=Enterobacter cloacae complex TaxID=354276 RepID=UPI0009B20B1E|nr:MULTISPECIES: hypothetical protein [Enterobacter cloacae complex]MCK6787156.1 hypothetical protein [Enterobacter roggenkampii]MCM7834712.1 hypothetical protein [Enterobacter asburiae]OQD47505.1 hypothetical protein BWZ29_20775 [Enterobacter cancerogenus]